MEIDWEATRGAVVLFGGLGVVATAVLALIVKDGKNAEELRNQRFHYIAQRWGLEAAHRFIHKRVQVGDSVEFVQLTLGRATYIDRKVTPGRVYAAGEVQIDAVQARGIAARGAPGVLSIPIGRKRRVLRAG